MEPELTGVAGLAGAAVQATDTLDTAGPLPLLFALAALGGVVYGIRQRWGDRRALAWYLVAVVSLAVAGALLIPETSWGARLGWGWGAVLGAVCGQWSHRVSGIISARLQRLERRERGE